MDLKNQIKLWERQLNFNKIIKAIEKLRPEAQTPELKVELAACYINRTHGSWAQRKSFEKALQILRGIDRKKVDNDFYYFFSLGNAYYNLDQWTYAFPWFKDALKREGPRQSKKMTKMLMLNCEKNVLRPQFRQPFASRVKQVWAEFVKVEPTIRESMLGNKANYLELNNQCEELFEKAIQHCGLNLECEDGICEIEFFGDDNLLKFFEIQYLKDHAPESIKKNWKIHCGYALLEEPIDEKTKEILESNFIKFTGEKDGIFTFDIFSPDSEPSNNDENEQKEKKKAWEEMDVFERDYEDIEFVEGWIDDLIGIVTRFKFIQIDEVLRDGNEKTLMSLHELPKFLQEKGIDIHDSTRALLDKRMPYTRKPKQKPTLYRDDIEWGWTKCASVLNDYADEIDDDVIPLEADGSAIGCLFYATDNFKGANRENQLKEFREELIKRLSEEAGGDAFEIIGEAHGTTFDYLDILGWDITKVLTVAYEFFKRSNVSFAGYHPLRKRCGSVRLCGENKFIPYRKPGSDKILDPREKESMKASIFSEDEPEDDNNPLLSSFWKPKDTIQ